MTIITTRHLTPEIARSGCFVKGMSNEAYHAYSGISKSGLDVVHRSPAHFRYGATRQSTRAMNMGTAIHTALLEPERFESDYLLLRDVKDRRASEYKQAIKYHNSDNVLVAGEADKVAGMQESVMAQPAAAKWLTAKGYRELSAFVQDPETGVMLRCRYDLLVDAVSVDLKKTRDSSPPEFAKSVYNYRYHVQAAMYSHIFELITGRQLESFKFIAVEEEPPHCAMVYTLDEEALAIGYQEYRKDLETYANCTKTGDWHGYPMPEQEIGLPSWAVNNFENELEVEL